jgi:hypothetical protein
MSTDLKAVHNKAIIENVAKTPNGRGILKLGNQDILKWFKIKNSPCIPPQKINCHPAPCHNPHRSMVIIKFLRCREKEHRFPPKGIYR